MHNEHLALARASANSGDFDSFLNICQQIIDTNPKNKEALLDTGALLLGFGFVSAAKKCFIYLNIHFPDDLRATVNLANMERDTANHDKAGSLYLSLLKAIPENAVIHRNLLVGSQYDPSASNAQRLAQARAWGEWAILKSGGHRSRPYLEPSGGRPLKIGYVSADFCQHTVGLFVKDTIKAHDRNVVSIYSYSSGIQKDWVRDEISANSVFRDIAMLDDKAAAKLIQEDNIDILVDLSGHTAGSRLLLFAYRPAPVLISWLGYFATTGLEYIDAVLLDEWHAPCGAESQFIEPIIRLPLGRLCYVPVPFAPATSDAPPCLKNGYITFGSFNNTAKYGSEVFEQWVKVLKSIPDSKLILKWRTFNDGEYKESVRNFFISQGIDALRIDLRGPSFHVDMLREYSDIDIALDPFPFTGGLTSCEALWMGVPVITRPMERVVSRQTFAFLSSIGLLELVAQDADDYVRIAVDLADNRDRLVWLRKNLRKQMQTSSLMDVIGFTRGLEHSMLSIYRNIEAEEKVIAMTLKTILHVGPGHRQNGAKLPVIFQTAEWQEIRLDIDAANEPDIVGSMMDMSMVMTESMDAVYSSHNIEHVYAYEVSIVLKEFLRVLKPNGFLVVTCPDLQSICALVADDKLDKPAYESPAGSITPLDILYGHGAALAAGHHYMAHKCGFTLKTLTLALQNAGFQTVAGKRRAAGFDLWAVGSKMLISESSIVELAGNVFPL